MTSNFPFDPQVRNFSLVNAYALARAAKLAYRPPEHMGPALQGEWGFDDWQYFDQGSARGFAASQAGLILLSFRGTKVDHLEDWFADANIQLEPGSAGRVHAGFQHALLRGWKEIQSLLDAYRGDDHSHALWITGHSLGAALATLATAKLLWEEQRVVQGLYLFGSPRVGDNVFATAFDRRFGAQTFRFVNNNDVVTRLPIPTRLFPYRHVGRLKYFDHHSRLYGNTSWLHRLLDRVQGRVADLGNPGAVGIKDHHMDRYESLVERSLHARMK